MRVGLIIAWLGICCVACSLEKEVPVELSQGVFYVLDPECPLSKRYSKYINEMEYHDLPVFLVFTESNSKAVDEFLESYISIDYSLVRDKKKRLVKKLGGTIYPEGFLVAEDKEIEYHGLINNWYASLSRRRKGPSKHYLQDAITNYMQDQIIDPVYVEPIGCYIELTVL